MKHLGDITKINGAEIELVDVIVGGSPCQDLSVAGKRSGLDGERSGLFMEQIRIVREQRSESIKRADNPIRPRYMVWENVPGAFSSNKAEDFRIVLEETARIADSSAVIPRPPNGKWATAGCIMGDGWSIAWRVLDAQFWGVPQRRRRIALVADFGGESAPEILFEREGVRRDSAESGTEGEGAAGDVAGGAGETECYGIDQQGGKGTANYTKNIAPTILSDSHGTPHAVCYPTLQAMGQGVAEPVTYPGVGITSKQNASKGTPGVCHTLNQDSRNYVVPTTYFLQGNGIDRADTAGCNGKGWREDVCYTPNTIDRPAVFDARGNGDGSIAPTMTGDHQNRVTDYTGITVNQSVRRLTPLECERLQGYEDNWTNIPPQTDVTAEDLSFWRTVWDEWDDMNGKKRHSDKQIIKWLQSEPADSARYKALGNSIALPPWRFVLGRIYQHGARTLGSLFDGIGGFPLIWSELPDTATLWASEIEPFPIAVTTIRFNGSGLRGN